MSSPTLNNLPGTSYIASFDIMQVKLLGEMHITEKPYSSSTSMNCLLEMNLCLTITSESWDDPNLIVWGNRHFTIYPVTATCSPETIKISSFISFVLMLYYLTVNFNCMLLLDEKAAYFMPLAVCSAKILNKVGSVSLWNKSFTTAIPTINFDYGSTIYFIVFLLESLINFW